METKRADLYLMAGIICNILLAAAFVYFYFASIPNPDALQEYSDAKIKGLSIYNENLNKAINTLNKVEGLPINVDQSELGKLNPYSN